MLTIHAPIISNICPQDVRLKRPTIIPITPRTTSAINAILKIFFQFILILYFQKILISRNNIDVTFIFFVVYNKTEWQNQNQDVTQGAV
jgi:hypothetical protein